MSGDLLKRFPNAPKDSELITPVLLRLSKRFGQRKISMKDEMGYEIARRMAIYGTCAVCVFELEAGDFDIMPPVGRMSLWQRIKHRFWLWRTRRKVKRCMRRKE